jgi:Na+-translocating ferredoxin:NAD+ oxidoreductase RNF subunit RnfB
VWSDYRVQNVIRLVNTYSLRTLDYVEVKKTKILAFLKSQFEYGFQACFQTNELSAIVAQAKTIIRGCGAKEL